MRRAFPPALGDPIHVPPHGPRTAAQYLASFGRHKPNLELLDYQLNIDGSCVPGPHPPRIDLGSGRATLLDLPLDPKRELKSLELRALANEVVVGLMSVTLLRE